MVALTVKYGLDLLVNERRFDEHQRSTNFL